MASRADRSPFARWWWTVDRWLLAGLAALIVAGIVFGLAASPPVAERLGLSTFHFVNRQGAYLVPASLVLLGASFLNPRGVRRTAGIVFAVSLALVVATLVVGPEVKGARRWLQFGGVGVQPSEFLKPAFVVLAAWAFSEGARRADRPGTWIAFGLLPITLVPLVLQPDIGQTILVALVWAGLFLIAGLHALWVVGLGGVGLLGAFAAYRFLPHVTARIDRFMDKGAGDTFQVDTAIEAFTAGGWVGKGPGEGTIKRVLPDAHTDFMLAAIAEEFGVVVCLGLVALFAAIVLRGLWLAAKDPDPFGRYAAAGLTMLFGVQGAINMAVNLHLMPPKGMTLPFVSYGGSSLISLALMAGFLLAVTRRRPRAALAAPRREEPGEAEPGEARPALAA